MDGKELIWVDKQFAERYNRLTDKNGQSEERFKELDAYIKTISESSKREFRANLEALEEDVAVYTGLMLKVRQAFEKAKNEALQASYALWEEYDKELPSVSKKVDGACALLDPLEKKLNSINEYLKKINVYEIERLIEAIEKLNGLYGTSRQMFEFVVNHFSGRNND